jgi:xanthine/uracil permease
MFVVALAAAILYMLVSVFSETEVETRRWRIFAVAIGVGLIEYALTKLLSGWVWALAILLLSVVLISVALTYWCGTPRKQAIKIAGIYTAIRIGLGVVIILVFRPVQ